MLVLVISEYSACHTSHIDSTVELTISPAYALGIAFRFGLHNNPDSLMLYVLYNLFATLSPCGFIAGEYVLLGRLARWLGGERHVLIPAKKITLVFVMSDVLTFLTQVCFTGVFLC